MRTRVYALAQYRSSRHKMVILADNLTKIYSNFSENCFISFNGVLKLGDFGFARTIDGDELSRTFCGSTVYAAPEILAASEDYNAFYSDIWSCGIILYAMFTAKLPFNREKLTRFTEDQVVEGNFKYKGGSELVHGYFRLHRCW